MPQLQIKVPTISRLALPGVARFAVTLADVPAALSED